ncbi:MAG: DUF4394 domain-containing protein, partial [Bacteroidales bacterium]|nr:DUF4394 domain-containing protein [Bacteroidales bacterium]
MKKFTKFWQLMMVLLVSSSIVFGQASDRKNAEKITKTDPTNSVFNVEVNNLIQNGDKELVTEFINKSKVNEWKKVKINLKGKGVAYAYVAYDPTGVLPQGPAYFDTDDPGTITSLAPTTSGDFIAGGTWADGVWYGVEYGTGNFYSIDETNGDMNLIGTAANMNGIAYDGTTMYGASSTDFYTIDISTGAATYVGSMGSGGGVMIALACDNSGTIYGIDLGDDNLYTIDPATGAATVVGPLGININYAQDAEYDKDNDVLYLAGYTTSGELYTIDPATGAATYVGGFQGSCEMTAFAIPYTGFDNDIGMESIVSPVTGPELTSSEPVTVIVKNYGAVAQSGFDVYYTIDGGGQVTETVSATINGGESYEYTFTQTADLSVYGIYVIEACTDLTGDENPNNDCQDVSVENYGLPTMEISPDSINVILDPFATTTEYIDITNNGNGTLNWNAQIVYPEGKGAGTGLTGLTKDVIASEEALEADV